MRGHRRPIHHQTASTLLTIVLLCGTAINTTGDRINSHEFGELLQDAMDSLERMVAFFGQDYSSVNVDGLFGIRVGQGSVNQTLEDCMNPRVRCPYSLIHRLEGLNHEIENIVQHAMPYVEAQDPQYFKQFRPTLDGPYILHYQTEFIQGHAEIHGDRKYDEEKGDMCLSLLMGTYNEQPKCSVTDDCWSFMTSEHHLGYVLTHQLLYFIVADKTGCVPVIDARLRSRGAHSIRDVETKKCAIILADAQHEERHSHVNILQQDLFLEQSLLCSILGYQNFMNTDWVRMVLSWQNGDGCFSMSPSLNAVESEITKLRGEERRLLRLMKDEATNIDHAPPVTGRKLMREKVMKGNCLAHKTGLGFGLVGAYIRHFVRMLYAPGDFDH